jgi:hypothetical protein
MDPDVWRQQKKEVPVISAAFAQQWTIISIDLFIWNVLYWRPYNYTT